MLRKKQRTLVLFSVFSASSVFIHQIVTANIVWQWSDVLHHEVIVLVLLAYVFGIIVGGVRIIVGGVRSV